MIALIRGGFANAIYRFMSAYALAKKLSEPLIIDISYYYYGSYGFLLDLLEIPDTIKTYNLNYNIEVGLKHELEYKSIPTDDLKTQFILDSDGYDETIPHYIIYNQIEDYCLIEKKYKAFMTGNFFDRKKYYDFYYEELKKYIKPRLLFPEIEEFKKKISMDVDTIGIHIRRTDFITEGINIEGEYYKAALQWLLENFSNCTAYVFSDDIKYAKEILGEKKYLNFVNFCGNYDADFCEFFCLSLCNHKVLTRGSTYGELAEELKANDEYHVVCYKSIKGKTEYIQNKDENYGKLFLSDEDIEKYSKIYDYKLKVNDLRDEKNDYIENIIFCNDAKEKLNKIARCMIDSSCMSDEMVELIALEKLKASVEAERYDIALQVASTIYDNYSGKKVFMEPYIKALFKCGYDKEAQLERRRMQEKKCDLEFLIIPFCKSEMSFFRYPITVLGETLHHMGYKVTFLVEPMNENEKNSIVRNEKHRYIHGGSNGCKQYLIENVHSDEIDGFIKSHFEGNVVIISRKLNYFIENYKVIFPDFSDNCDPECIYAKNELNEMVIDEMREKADYILTCSVLSTNSKKTIYWENEQKTENIINDRWTLDRQNRLYVNQINMANKIISIFEEI